VLNQSRAAACKAAAAAAVCVADEYIISCDRMCTRTSNRCSFSSRAAVPQRAAKHVHLVGFADAANGGGGRAV
jgi:hypothetical protein